MIIPFDQCIHATYFQWHNNANYATKDTQTLIIRYDEYETSFQETTVKIFDFLEMQEENKDLLFKKGKSYRDYYTDDQMVAISKLIRHLAQPFTCELLSPYLI